MFGITSVAAFIFSPIFGAYGERIGTKFLYNGGAVIQALSCIAFGFVVYLDNLSVFLGVSYILRYKLKTFSYAIL